MEQQIQPEIQPRKNQTGRFARKFGHGLWVGLRVALKSALAIVLLVVVAAGALGAAFFMAPHFEIGSERLRQLAAKAEPFGVELKWEDAKITLDRTQWHSKSVQVAAVKFCARWKWPAAGACFDRVSLGAELGLKNEETGAWFDVPTRIAPIELIGGDVRVDLDAMPKSDPNAKPSSFSVVDLLRKRILPRWQASGSKIELSSLAIDSGLKKWRGAISLATNAEGGGDAEYLRVVADELRDAASGFPRASGRFIVRWPETGPASLPQKSAAGARSRTSPGDEHAIESRGEQAAARAETQTRRMLAGMRVSPPNRLAPWTAELKIDAALSKTREIAAGATAVVRAWDDLDYDIQAVFRGLSPLMRGSLTGGYRGQELNGVVSVKAGSFGGAVTAASAVGCAYLVNLQSKEAGLKCGPESVRIAVRETIAPPSLRARRELFDLRPTFEFKALNIAFGDRLAADVSANVQLRQANLIAIDAKAEGAAEGKTAKDMQWHAQADVDFDVPDFARVVAFLRGTPFAAPAPLNSLGGPARLRASAQVDQAGGRAPFSLATKLASIDQRLFATVSGEANLENGGADGWFADVSARARFDDVKISAPRVALKAPPQLMPDGRFKSFAEADKEKEKPKPSNVSVSADIETSTSGAIQIATNMTTAAIPVSLDLAIGAPPPAPPATKVNQSPDPGVEPISGATMSVSENAPENPAEAKRLSSPAASRMATRAPAGARAANAASREGLPPPAVRGAILIGRTPIRFMRRDARLESMRIDLLPDGRKRLDGRVSVDYPDYDIDAFIGGYADSPQLRFESVPPLPQDKIIAALLFGKPMNDLSADEQSSAANMNAAIADAALSLSSLYFLADTPIEGIGYDPERGLVTARVGLGGGNSLELGSGSGGSTEVGVRRKLSRDLVFNTYVERVGDTEEKIVSAFVEWVKKF